LTHVDVHAVEQQLGTDVHTQFATVRLSQKGVACALQQLPSPNVPAVPPEPLDPLDPLVPPVPDVPDVPPVPAQPEQRLRA
jgi:hypothetical protein